MCLGDCNHVPKAIYKQEQCPFKTNHRIMSLKYVKGARIATRIRKAHTSKLTMSSSDMEILLRTQKKKNSYYVCLLCWSSAASTVSHS